MTIDRFVAIANGKGGVGKTSLATNLAGLAAAAGWKTLFIDLDAQGDAGDDLGYNWAGRSDEGEHLTRTLLGGSALTPVLTEVRPNLDVVPGGSALVDLSAIVNYRLLQQREGGLPGFGPEHVGLDVPSQPVHQLLHDALAPIADNYDLIVADTPPENPGLQQVAFGAARWIVVPTRSDVSSIKGIKRLAEQISEAMQRNPELAILGAALVLTDPRHTTIAGNAVQRIIEVLGTYATPFKTIIRYVPKPSDEGREAGKLAHELAEQVQGAEPVWVALRDGRRPERQALSAPALAEDYVLLCQEILTRIDQAENAEEAP